MAQKQQKRHDVTFINLLIISWQGFQSVVRTLGWEEIEKDIKDDRREAELVIEIEQIRELLDE